MFGMDQRVLHCHVRTQWARPRYCLFIYFKFKFIFPLLTDEVMDGCYVNYPDVVLVNWQQLYYKGNYARLQSAKRAWDPTNFFFHAQSVQL